MSDPARTDQNLLFGILALQMDFISRDALVAAMNAWVLEKATPLGQILLRQGSLHADTHALLEALVHKHLQMHGGDAHQSLAAVNSLGPVREQLQQIADADLHASLAHVSPDRAAGEDPDPYATRPPSAGTPTSAGLRFSQWNRASLQPTNRVKDVIRRARTVLMGLVFRIPLE
jgi:hypothetical protein